MANGIQIIGLEKLPEFRPGDDVTNSLEGSAKDTCGGFLESDILVVTQKIISKVENCVVDLSNINPGIEAVELAQRTRKDPRLTELILQESKRIVRVEEERGVIITETKHGFICANAGIDSSNIPGKDLVATLPLDSNRSAALIRSRIVKRHKFQKFGVIISDTFGRPWREGHINFAIGSAGIQVTDDYTNGFDRVGKPLRVTKIAIIDVLAAASELVCRKTNGVPAALFRNFPFEDSTEDVSSLLRPIEKDLFR